MPEMKSPDGTETLMVPNQDGVQVMNALGWTIVGANRSSDAEAKPKRGPGRPRKAEAAEE